MRKKIDISGNRFGKLIVKGLSSEKIYGNKQAIWECVCDCGTICHIDSYSLRHGLRKSCGCLWRPFDEKLIFFLKSKLELNSKWDDQCQLWTGKPNKRGIGTIALSPHCKMDVRNVSWLIHIGKINKKQKVLNTCGNPLCFRVEHLILEKN